MKKYIKRIIDAIGCSLFAKNTSAIYKEIDKFDYISFDMFDTLIKRNIKNPSDIFDYIQIEYNRNNNKINNFKENRIKAEKRARLESKDDEIRLEQIYHQLEGYYLKSELEKLMNLEIEMEINFCTKNDIFYQIYDYCVSNNKTIFITSDMYLPKDVITKILENNHYVDYKKLYLSSDYLTTKHSGGLFKKVLEEQKINEKQLIHIGDSLYSDYYKPKKLRIKSLLIKRHINNCNFNSNYNDIEYNVLYSFLNNNVKEKNLYGKFGYEVLGPILYSFTTWINKVATEDGIKKLYFLARDAHIIMDAYNMRFKGSNDTRYINVSRRSMLMPGLDNVNSMDDLLYAYKSILKKTSRVIDVFNVLGFDHTKYINDENIIQKFLMDLTEIEKQNIFSSIKEDLILKSKQQKEYLKEYLNQNDMNGNIGLVDVGWNGTIQFYLDKVIKANSIGYYYGVNKDSKYNEYLINRKGCLFQNDCLSENQAIVYLNSGLFEIMFLALEGTTLSYNKKNNKIIPELAEVNYSENMVEIIKAIQDSALQFVKDVEQSKMKEYMNNIPNDVYFENFRNLTKHPSNDLIEIFKNVDFENFDTRKLISNKSFFYYLIFPKKFYSDFMNSYCKTIFLKRVFKFNLPYYKILIKLYVKGKNSDGGLK